MNKKPGKKQDRKKYVGWLIFIILILLDQLTKLVIFNNNVFYDLKIFAINIVKNTGASFGLLQNSNSHLIWISFIVLGILMMYYDKFPEKSRFFLMLLTAGLIGNLIDRIFRGFVLDFIDFGFWPVFNLADAMISIGVIGIIIFVLLEKKLTKTKKS